MRRPEHPARRAPMDDPRILLIRPDHLGDVLLTLPATAALKRSLPRAHLTYLVAEGLERLTDRSPDVDETISLPFPPPHAPTERAEGELSDAAALTLRDRFDVAVLLRPGDRWSGSLVRAARVPVRVGFEHDGMDRFLTDTVPETPNRHAVWLAHDVMTMALASLNGEIASMNAPSIPSLTDRVFVPSREDHTEAEEAIARVKSKTGTRPVILHPGTGWQLKNWPSERWGALASHLHRRFGFAPIVTGGAGERELVEQVVLQSGRSAVGMPPLSLGGFAALLAEAALVVASDSGPLHLAAMLGTAVVGLYGPGNPALAAPWCQPENQRIVRVDLPCSPCGVMHDPPCGALRHPACVAGVGVETVAEAIESLRAGVP
ncbi:MAG TPA: glycosyltransferase family 9 protein [Actinomycetota bacterium]|nr:glycosyltransferase family 9 protein [Actinomycetota bacterium]